MRTNLYRLPSEETLTDAKLNEFIMRHSGECAFRYSRLQEAYETEYPILHEPLKPKWKPDNRIMVNFAKYIVDTMNGFFIGHPAAKYFAIPKISRDQLEDWAQRKGMTLGEAERWLAPLL